MLSSSFAAKYLPISCSAANYNTFGFRMLCIIVSGLDDHACLQSHGSSVMWLLVSALTLWSPADAKASSFCSSSATQSAHTSGISQGANNSIKPDVVRQAIMLYSMMRQVGAAMLQNQAQCADTAMQMTELLAAALQSGLW